MKRESTYFHFLAFVILYFFFNNTFLPQGLLYTTLLTPLFLYWLYKKQRLPALLKWSVLLLIPVPFQLIVGVDPPSYIISSLLVVAAWVFLFTALEAVSTIKGSLEDIFYRVLLVNAVLLFIALVILPFGPLRDLMWDSQPMSQNMAAFPRLKLLAYEPSHYALLLAPVFLFFLLQIMTGKSGHPLLLAAGIGIPLVLSFSFGAIGALFIATLIGVLFYFRKLSLPSKRLIFYSLAFLLVFIVAAWIIWPGNPFFQRMENIITGADSSAKGRLEHSFMFAKDLVVQHQAWMGVGPGQVKILAHDLIINFYRYSGEYAEVVRIPNSSGEMLATYGVYGFVLKILFEIYFFLRLKIYRNLYSLVLFLFIFIYQFTGSFLVNAAEIGIWALVFQSRFIRFDFDHLNADQA
jgi:hypothetical protein